MTVPSAPEVDASWLSAAMSTADRPVRVDAVDVTPIAAGGYRLTPTYGGVGHDGLPAHLVLTTGTADDDGHRRACAFHASVADRVHVPVPRCLHGVVDEETRASILLVEEAGVAVDPAADGDEHQVRLAVAAIAGLHAPTWCAPQWLRFSGLTATLPDSVAARTAGNAARTGGSRFIERYGDVLASDDRDTVAAAMAVVAPWLSSAVRRYSLLHGDFRFGHLRFSRDRTAVWVTGWHTLAIGLPMRDVAGLLGTAFEPELRSSAEHDLLAEYHDALVRRGVDDYDLEMCWQDYRFAMLQPLLTAVLAPEPGEAGAGEAGRRLTEVHRACCALRELRTLEVVAEVVAAEQAAARYLTHVNVH